MSETPDEELMRRAKRLIASDGIQVSQDQRELILNGWTKWPIIVVNWCVDDLNRTIYTTVYYDTPAPRIVVSENPDDLEIPSKVDGAEHVPMILAALRQRMLLDDLADV